MYNSRSTFWRLGLANTKTAKKQLLITARNHQRNQHYGTMLKTALKKARLAISSTDAQAAQQAMNTAVATLQRSATKGIIKRQNANRRVSRIMRAYHKRFNLPTQSEQAS
jgi:small subunit ribosomal protein S20